MARTPVAKKKSMKAYVEQVQLGDPFSFARYGDGEWHTILGHYNLRNSNGCTFTKPLSDALRAALRKGHPYEHSILRIARRNLGSEIEQFLKKYEIRIEWTLGDTILEESLKGNLFPLMEQLRMKRILYVGPKHCRGLNSLGFFQYVDYIQPPPRNAFIVRHDLVRNVAASIKENKIDIVGYSSGLASKVFIDDIYQITGGGVTQIDFGSMFDGYFGIPSRTYIRRGKINFRVLHELNTKENPNATRDQIRANPRVKKRG